MTEETKIGVMHTAGMLLTITSIAVACELRHNWGISAPLVIFLGIVAGIFLGYATALRDKRDQDAPP